MICNRILNHIKQNINNFFTHSFFIISIVLRGIYYYIFIDNLRKLNF